MIVRMSKLEIAGPKELLMDLLDCIREAGVLQPETLPYGDEQAGGLRNLILDEKTAAERLFLANLHRLTGSIISLLPDLPVRETGIDPHPLMDTITAAAERHLADCRAWGERRYALNRERSELERHLVLLGAIDGLLGGGGAEGGLEFIGITLRDQALGERLREVLTQVTGGSFSLTTTLAADGTLVGLIATPKAQGGRIKQLLSREQFPELPSPAGLGELPLPERIRRVQMRSREMADELASLDRRRLRFARQWLPYYRRLDQWLRERLTLMAATSVVRETGMCFVMHGWVRTDTVAALARRLGERFGGRVAMEELDLRDQDLEQVPVALKNPPYLRPFERITRLLPLPRYTSWDPTPFIGIFFPLFFGIMLGDAGHGLLLLAAALLLRRLRPDGPWGDGARIMLVSSLFAILFGILFGEVFGEAGARLLHLEPLVPERSRAILPMLVFSLALGVAHVLLGLLLGLISSIRRHERREAAGRAITIGLVVCLAALVTTLFVPSPWLLCRSIMLTTAVLLPLLVIFSGLLAPLELLRHIGNIVSYARIMAIGLGSAMLANAANHLAGLAGDLILGTLAAIVLHGLAIVLGTFAPAIHALRLHFVEFFSKFVEHGGRGFEPLHK